MRNALVLSLFVAVVCIADSVSLVKGFEGEVKRGGWHVVYDDANPNRTWNGKESYEEFAGRCNGKPTIGYGFTSKSMVSKCRITDAEADAELGRIVERIGRRVDGAVRVGLSSNQRDALISFVFNVGFFNFSSSTMLRKLNSGDYDGAADEFVRWKYVTVNGQKVVSKGLLRRRVKESSLFSGK